MLNVKILGTGCPNCRKLEALAREAAKELELEAVFEKVDDINQIVSYGVFITPGLVINEKVYSSGKIPSKEQIKEWLLEETKK
jgi:small redox-active disulfide protein 2